VHQPARWGLGAVAAGVTVIVGLDVTSLGEIDPLRRTISQHGLGPEGWIFGLGVALLAAGSAAICVSLARRRLAGIVGTLTLALWSAGLFVAAWFPKQDWSLAPTLSGGFHRAGSFVAFLSLPIAAVVIARSWRRAERRGAALTAFAFGLGSVLWVAGMGAMALYGAHNGLPWWRVMPLGLVERVLAVTEVAALIALGVWAAAHTPALARSQGGDEVAKELAKRLT
jgi:hypothetical membrane protein